MQYYFKMFVGVESEVLESLKDEPNVYEWLKEGVIAQSNLNREKSEKNLTRK